MMRIWIAFLFILIRMGNVSAHSCETPLLQDNRSLEVTKDLDWIASDTLIYGLDDKSLYQAHLNQINKTPLVVLDEKFHHFIQIAPDGYSLYFTTSASEDYSQPIHHYVYNLRTHSLTPISGLPFVRGKGNLEWIGFSPNSLALAWQLNPQFAIWQPWTEPPSLYVAAAPHFLAKPYTFPSDIFQSEIVINCFPSQWGLDSLSIYSNLYEGSGQCLLSDQDEKKLGYFKISLSTGQSTRIDGSYDFDIIRWRFKNFYREGSQRLNLSYPCGTHHCELSRDEALKSTMSEAMIRWDNDGAPYLSIKSNHKQTFQLKAPLIDGCGDPALSMISWIDEGRYLIFEYNRSVFIYGVVENRLSLLPQLTGVYLWPPPQQTPYVLTQAGRKDRYHRRYFIPAYMDQTATVSESR